MLGRRGGCGLRQGRCLEHVREQRIELDGSKKVEFGLMNEVHENRLGCGVDATSEMRANVELRIPEANKKEKFYITSRGACQYNHFFLLFCHISSQILC